MPPYFGAVTLVLLIGMVLTRAALLKRKGIKAINFGKRDKTDFLILPFAIIYIYLVLASAFGFPTVGAQPFLHSDVFPWLGVLFCLIGLALLLWSLVSFGKSFRVGIDADHPDRLITTGVFAFSRNPIYVAFGFVLLGEFLIFANWILLVYLVAGIWLFHRQVLREEEYLKKYYGEEYLEYQKRVRRYL